MLQEFSIVRFYGDKAKADAVYKGCEPLTPDDIAEVVVFNAGRRENVVIADTLIFPNHQVFITLHKLCLTVLIRTLGGRHSHAQEDMKLVSLKQKPIKPSSHLTPS